MRRRHTLIAALVCFVLAGVCLFLLVAPAHCDDSWMIAVPSAADLLATEYALAQHPTGLREANPLMRDQAQRIAIKVAATAVLVYVYKRAKRNNPKGARVFAIVAGSVFMAATVWNVSQAR